MTSPNPSLFWIPCQLCWVLIQDLTVFWKKPSVPNFSIYPNCSTTHTNTHTQVLIYYFSTSSVIRLKHVKWGGYNCRQLCEFCIIFCSSIPSHVTIEQMLKHLYQTDFFIFSFIYSKYCLIVLTSEVTHNPWLTHGCIHCIRDGCGR